MNGALDQYLVTTSASGVSSTKIWDAQLPLSLGSPIHWVIEKTTEGGFRARKISLENPPPTHSKKTPTILQFTAADVQKGKLLELPGTQMQIRIRPTQTIQPLYESTPSLSEKSNQLQIFTRRGRWVLATAMLSTQKLSVRWNHQEVFSIRKSAEDFEITPKVSSLTLIQKGQTTAWTSTLTISPREITQCKVQWELTQWDFGLCEKTEHADLKPTAKTTAKQDPEALMYKKSLQWVAGVFALFFITAWLWPKPAKDPNELIPAQVAKIVLSKPLQKSSAENMGGTPKLNAQQKVEKSAVVQAFRAQALRNSINGLLKGGMTRLLAQSDFVSGNKASIEAKRLFDSPLRSALATGAEIGNNNSKAVQVASLGGAGAGTGGGVGYGRGNKAGVSGQGFSQVSLDMGESSVEDGLSKDEVGEVIHRHMSEVRYCYESAIQRTPGIEGRLIVNFSIGGSGNVTTSEVKSSTLPDPRLDDCIIRKLTSWKFPQPKGGITVAVSYPFIFKTLGR